jgi:DNA-binding transcriptional regulator LsrR (DeoR family)
MNIVMININDPFAEEYLVVQELKKAYNLDDAVVVDTGGKGDAEALEAIAQNVSLTLTSHVSNGGMVGVSSGFTVSSCSQHTVIYNRGKLTFVPLIAGESPEGEAWYANENCRRFAKRFNGRYMVLNTPMVIRNDRAREEMCGNSAVKPVLDSYEQLDVLLLGIGELDRESTLGRQSPFYFDELAACYKQGIRAMIGASFVDADGNEALHEKSDFMIGIKVPQIKRCKVAIGVAIGENKIDAIRAVLKGGIVNVICTDLRTARLLLEAERAGSPRGQKKQDESETRVMEKSKKGATAKRTSCALTEAS